MENKRRTNGNKFSKENYNFVIISHIQKNKNTFILFRRLSEHKNPQKRNNL